MQVCPRCGEENPDRFRLCGFCGTSLGPDLAKHEVRKTVTIVFCDLKGSTSLAERPVQPLRGLATGPALAAARCYVGEEPSFR